MRKENRGRRKCVNLSEPAEDNVYRGCEKEEEAPAGKKVSYEGLDSLYLQF